MLPDPWNDFRLPFVALLLLFTLFLFQRTSARTTPAPVKPKRPPRPLKPHTPDDCSECVRSALVLTSPAATPVRPWRERKSARGRPKHIDTEGYACNNVECEYQGITDATIHALVGYGHHGVDHSIQDFYCEACHHKFSARRHTALYRLKTRAARVGEVLAALAEGLAVVAVVRVFGQAEGTITTWLTRAGMHSARLHRQRFQRLHLGYVQLDELRTTLRNKGQEIWLWLALEAQTKIIAAEALGPRSQPTAQALIHGLVQVLAPGCVPLFTSDGLNLYFYSLTAHFGAWVELGGTKKNGSGRSRRPCFTDSSSNPIGDGSWRGWNG